MLHKVREWAGRYLLANLTATASATLGALLGFALSGNGIVAAYAGTVGDNVGYYGTIVIRDIRASHIDHKNSSKKYGFVSFCKTIRNLVLEFGSSELLDSLVVRPFMMWFFPHVMNNLATGVIVGKIVADVIFYIPTIIAYELRKKHLKD